MKSATTRNSARPSGSWRTIRQEVTSHAMSKKGRRRRLSEVGRVVLLAALLGGLAWGAYAFAESWRHDRAGVAKAIDGESLGEPVLITDGVLTRDWLKETLRLPREATLLSLDLAELRDRLQAHRQVKLAMVRRNFPKTLVVTLQERMPVARIQVEDGARHPRMLLVAPDGVAFEGRGFDRELIATLPWLSGFKLKRDEGGYAPIPGMEAVSSLLTTAQTEAPWLYRDWLIVSLARLESHNEIVVSAQDLHEIVFTRGRSYFQQLAQLDLILDRTRDRTDAQLQKVNLAIGNQAAVLFDRPPEQVGALQRPTFNIQPRERKGKRDL